MNEKKCVLTISILASNRKDTLPKTLESIKPILDNVSSELIITDTGCDEEMLSVIRGYTDNIIKFQWCNDFSKARNTAINCAKGQWFLFVDDDEWFEDVTEIVDFFNNDERNKYGCGRYIQRNYHDMEGGSFIDAPVGRIFRLNAGTKFIGAIHEKPINVEGPVKNFSSYVHHYGYVYKSEEDRIAHYDRNVSLLLKQVEEEPNVARHYIHLAQEYQGAKKYDKVIEVALRGIENADMTTCDSRKNVPGMYAFVVFALGNQGKHACVVEKAKEYIESEYCNELCESMLNGFLALSYSNLGQYQEAVVHSLEFFRLKEYLEDNKEILYEQETAMLMYSLGEGNVANIAFAGMNAASNLKNFELLLTFSNYYKGFKGTLGGDIKGFLKKLSGMLIEESSIGKYVNVFDNILGNAQLREMTNMIVLELSKLEKSNREYLRLLAVLSYTSIDSKYLPYYKIMVRYNELSNQELYSLYEKVIENADDIMALDNQLWATALVKEIDIQSMLESSDLCRWIDCIDRWSVNVKIMELIQKKQYMGQIFKETSLYMQCFDMIMVEAMMFRKRLEGISLEELVAELRDWIQGVKNFYGKIYTDETFEKYESVLPNRVQVALMVEKMYTGKLPYSAKVKYNIVKKLPRIEGIMEVLEGYIYGRK